MDCMFLFWFILIMQHVIVFVTINPGCVANKNALGWRTNTDVHPTAVISIALLKSLVEGVFLQPVKGVWRKNFR